MTSRIVGLFTSLRTTVVLIVLISILMLLNVILPQEKIVGEAEFIELVRGRPLLHFLLVRLGLGSIPTSPFFISLMGLFFMNLVAVLSRRIVPTLRRIRFDPPDEELLARKLRGRDVLEAPLPDGWRGERALETLQGFGYRPIRVGVHGAWGVKNRRAALGFLLFHLSFLVLAGGGLLLYYTRAVGQVSLAEGQPFSGFVQIVREPKVGGFPPLEFRVVEVDPLLADGHRLHLGVTLEFPTPVGPEVRTGRVNHPVSWGYTDLLPQRTGLAPTFRLRDSTGLTIDLVAVSSQSLSDTAVSEELDGGRLQLVVHPLDDARDFPNRDALATHPVRISISSDEKELFDGVLRVGETISIDDYRLRLESLRYWVTLYVVTERGSAWLVAGFLMMVVGLVWRQLWYRREVGIRWDDERLQLYGRTEYLPWRFREELERIRATLVRAQSRPGEDTP